MKWKEWEVISKDETWWQNHEEKGLLKAEYIEDYLMCNFFPLNPGIIGYKSGN